jgi:cell division protein FtsB
VKRLPLILLGLAAVGALGLLSSIVTHGFQQVASAENERQQLDQEKKRLEQSIDELEATIEALRTRPEAVESMARRELGWIRPGETVLILATPTPAPLPISKTEPELTPILSMPD